MVSSLRFVSHSHVSHQLCRLTFLHTTEAKHTLPQNPLLSPSSTAETMTVSKQANLVYKLFGFVRSDGRVENRIVKNTEGDTNAGSSSTHHVFGTLGTIRVNAEAYENRSKGRSRVEIKATSPEDINALRTADPFLYYSLPASLRSGRRSSEPTGTKTEKLTVRRRTTISVERCPIEAAFLDCNLDASINDWDNSDVDDELAELSDSLLMLDVTDSFVLGSRRFTKAAHRRSSC